MWHAATSTTWLPSAKVLLRLCRSRQFLELERLAASPAMVVVPAFETEDEQIASLSARGAN